MLKVKVVYNLSKFLQITFLFGNIRRLSVNYPSLQLEADKLADKFTICHCQNGYNSSKFIGDIDIDKLGKIERITCEKVIQSIRSNSLIFCSDSLAAFLQSY